MVLDIADNLHHLLRLLRRRGLLGRVLDAGIMEEIHAAIQTVLVEPVQRLACGRPDLDDQVVSALGKLPELLVALRAVQPDDQPWFTVDKNKAIRIDEW
jgi:hypothetical protein